MLNSRASDASTATAHVHYNTITTTITTTVLWPFVRDYPSEPEPEETLTHSHLSWSSTILYQLSPSTMIHSILTVQCTCLTVFLHNLLPSPIWSVSWSGTLHFILHTFLQSSLLVYTLNFNLSAFSALRCWLGGRKVTWPLKTEHGYLSEARCKWFAYGPADATAIPSSLALLNSLMVLHFWCRLTQVVLE